MTAISFEGMSTNEMLAVYNQCADALGSKPVAKFADRATAEKRTRFILSQIATEKRPAPFGPGLPAPKVDEAPAAVAPQVQPQKEQAMADTELDFGARKGSQREAIINQLLAKKGEAVPIQDILSALGPDAKGGSLSTAFKCIAGMIAKNKLPVKLVKTKDGKAVSYGLFDA